HTAGLFTRPDVRMPLLSGILETHLSWNTTFAVVFCATGLPSCVAGLYFQRFLTMVQAASFRRGFPLVVVTAHSSTVPSGLITTLIATVPCSCRRIEIAGESSAVTACDVVAT